MDDLRRALYRLRFANAFLEKKGQAFEDWFCRLAEYALGSDFERIRPYGAEGDRKADGRSLSDRAIYQCYAPHNMQLNRLRAKVATDFVGALDHWQNWIRRWVFVHNDSRGLPAAVLEDLDTFRVRHPSVKIEVWTEQQLLILFERLDDAGLESLFGVAPGSRERAQVATEDIVGVVQPLERPTPAPGTDPIRAPSVDKIAKNALSDYVRILLDAGRRKDHVVQRYFDSHPHPDTGERVVEGFRRRYRSLRDAGNSPDAIFFGLQKYVGLGGEPTRQVASLAVLSYLFDRCDIFEDPES